MRHPPMAPVAVKAADTHSLEAEIDKVKERIRRRAYEIYCRRGRGGQGSALEDWKRAENECNAAPLAGMADEENDIRISACVPNVNAADITVDVLPTEIVIETDRNGQMERYKSFHLPEPVDVNRVEAHMQGSELDVTAPKAKAKRA